MESTARHHSLTNNWRAACIIDPVRATVAFETPDEIISIQYHLSVFTKVLSGFGDPV